MYKIKHFCSSGLPGETAALFIKSTASIALMLMLLLTGACSQPDQALLQPIKQVATDIFHQNDRVLANMLENVEMNGNRRTDREDYTLAYSLKQQRDSILLQLQQAAANQQTGTAERLKKYTQQLAQASENSWSFSDSDSLRSYIAGLSPASTTTDLYIALAGIGYLEERVFEHYLRKTGSASCGTCGPLAMVLKENTSPAEDKPTRYLVLHDYGSIPGFITQLDSLYELAKAEHPEGRANNNSGIANEETKPADATVERIGNAYLLTFSKPVQEPHVIAGKITLTEKAHYDTTVTTYFSTTFGKQHP